MNEIYEWHNPSDFNIPIDEMREPLDPNYLETQDE